MLQQNYNTNLIDLQDKDLEIISVSTIELNEKKLIEIHVFKPLEKSNKCCLKCNSNAIVTQSYHMRKIKFLPIAGINSFLFYKQRRFLCKSCGKTFNESSTLVSKNGTISNQTKKVILKECSKKQSAVDIAERTSVSHTTVNNEFIQNILKVRTPLSKILCIDEFKANTIAGKYALIIGDPVLGEIIDILPSRKQDYIYYYFQQIPDSERFSVEYIVTDLFESYRTIAKNLFWKSIHIADRFHWIRLATQAITKQRIRTMNLYNKYGETSKDKNYIHYYEITKRYHKLLIANSFNKEAWYFDQSAYVSQLKKEMTYQEIIEYIVNFDKDLEEAYLLLQDLYKLAKFTRHEDAEKGLLEWSDKVNGSERFIPELKQVTLTYRSWKKEIVNSFIINPTTKTRLTNGFLEGKNIFCKVIKRVGFGYKNFDIFRAKILYTMRKEKE